MNKPVGEYMVRCTSTEVHRDESGKIKAVFNIEFDDGTTGRSVLNLFGGGLEIARKKLMALKYGGTIAALADNAGGFAGKPFKAKVKEWQSNSGRINTDIELFLPDAGGKKVSGSDLAGLDLGIDINDAGWLTQ